MADGGPVKVLVTRTDRLGDLVLSLPAFALLADADPTGEVHAMVAPASRPLVAHDPHLTRVWTWHDGLATAARRELCGQLQAEKFDAVVMLQYRRPLARLLRQVGIGWRCGPLSQWSSWFLLNQGVRQNRSAAKAHEMVHNVALARHFLAQKGKTARTLESPLPRLYLTPAQRGLSHQFLTEQAVAGAKIVFLHPGSGGSALEWEPERFAAVANLLAADAGRRVFVTGAGSDAAAVAAMRPHLASAVTVLLDRYDLAGFMAVLATGDLFIGPSTGPLHIAAALGVPTLGLFPPVRTMHPRRWGPRGTAQAVSLNLVPEVECPASRRCQGARCRYYVCMKMIEVDRVTATALEIMGEVEH